MLQKNLNISTCPTCGRYGCTSHHGSLPQRGNGVGLMFVLAIILVISGIVVITSV